MSRHIIPNASGSPETCETVVGWDSGMDTFFATCSDKAKPEDEAGVFWVGGSPCEVPEVADLARLLVQHNVHLSLEMACVLAEDRVREGLGFAGRPAAGLLAAMADTYAGPAQKARISAALTGQDQAGEGR